jgi:carboxyl-terminal processing protease
LSQEKIENQIENISAITPKGTILWAIGLFISIAIILLASTIFILSDKNLYYPLRITASLSLIRELYPESYNDKKLLSLAREAMIAELDRYSGYLDKEELNRAYEEFTGSYGGIGITVVGHEHGLMVMSVREDGPAGVAGIKTGDVIIKADNVSVEGMNPLRATNYLRGQEGSVVEVGIVRNNLSDTITFELTRQKLKLVHLAYAGITSGKYLYLRVLDFEAGVTDEILAAFDSLYINNRHTIKGVLIDLRGNPGGLLSEAISVSDLFLDSGRLIVGVKGKSRWRRSELYSTDSDITNGLPLAVIVDRGSASASEIFAGAMKYSHRGIIVGDTTFGKGLVQELDELMDGSGMRLTIARYYFEGNIFLNDPNSEDIDNAVGIPPDYYIEFPDNEPFLLSLENSSILRDFAILHRNEIAADSNQMMISSKWFDDFLIYAKEKNFRFESDLSDELHDLMVIAALENYSQKTLESINKLQQISHANDSARFAQNHEYILQRIYQIAMEIQYGPGSAYQKAIIPYRKDIALAEKILSQEKID